MTRLAVFGLFAMAAQLAAPFANACAQQERSNPLLRNYRDSGRYPWIVKQDSLRGNADRIIGDFQTDHEAQEASQKLNDAEPHPFDWVFFSSQRSMNPERSAEEEPAAARPGKVPPPDSKEMPGPAPPIAGKASPQKPGPLLALKGKHFRGHVGKARVDVEFKERSFVVTGDIRFHGEWDLAGSAVTMSTAAPKSTFRGKFNGTVLAGLQIFADQRPFEQWSFTMVEKSKKAIPSSVLRPVKERK
jgi:hypothetical protein